MSARVRAPLSVPERVMAIVFSSMRAEKLPDVAGTQALAEAFRPASITAAMARSRRSPAPSWPVSAIVMMAIILGLSLWRALIRPVRLARRQALNALTRGVCRGLGERNSQYAYDKWKFFCSGSL